MNLPVSRASRLGLRRTAICVYLWAFVGPYRKFSDTMSSEIDTLIEDFELLDNWEERYRYVIELGRDLAPLSEADHSAANKVKGCVSQVWLKTEVASDSDPVLQFTGDSDAHIVRGLIAILLKLISGKPASYIVATDVRAVFEKIGLTEHLTPQRSNGLFAMVERIKRDARQAEEPQAAQ